MTVETETELDLFADFVSNLTLENGSAMELEPFQRRMLADYFEGVTETLILISKKNGKSSVLAALALYHLCSTPDAECVIAAASRDQANVMLKQASGFVRRSGWLRARLQVKQREIVHRELGGTVRIIAAEVERQDGFLGSLALVDEIGRHRSGELYGVLRDGLGPRGGQMLSISTAGDDDESPLGQLRSRAYALPVQRRDGAYRYARSGDGSFCLHEWALDAGQDLDDLELVREANPASWQTVERLRERRDSPSTTPWQWARFACGVWLRGEDTLIQARDWDNLPVAMIPPGSPVYVGWDMAWRGRDTTAIVPIHFASMERRVVGDPLVLTPPEAGGMIDDRDVLSAILSLRDHRRYRIEAVIYDPNAGAAALAQQLARQEGLTMVEHSQHDGPMSLADGRFLEALRRRELAHSGHPVLRQHILNAIERPVSGGGFRFARPKHGPRRPIDCLTAASMAHSVAVAAATTPAPDTDWFMF